MRAIVRLIAEALAEDHGGYGPGDPETWANFSHEATIAVQAMRKAAEGHPLGTAEVLQFLDAVLDEAVS